MKSVRTEYQEKKEIRELAIYNDYNRFMAIPGAMATAADKYIMDKYSIFSKSTVWFIRQRVEKRLNAEGKL